MNGIELVLVLVESTVSLVFRMSHMQINGWERLDATWIETSDRSTKLCSAWAEVRYTSLLVVFSTAERARKVISDEILTLIVGRDDDNDSQGKGD
jgi:hypothetical protein